MIKVIDSYQYIKIPEKLIQDTNINYLSKIVFGKLLALTYNDGKCWASNKYLADFFKVSVRTIQKSITILYKNNYIIINPEDNNRNKKKRLIYINFDSF